MVDVDVILSMLSEDNPMKVQNKGLELAREIKNFQVFLQPLQGEDSKKTWENCAYIVCEKSDDDLRHYLPHLFRWIKDLEEPGAKQIFNRLKIMSSKSLLKYDLDNTREKASAYGDGAWLNNLNELLAYKEKNKGLEEETSIDSIIEMLSWNNAEEIQNKGFKLGREIKNLKVFFQPMIKGRSKELWENCAQILCEKSDEELTPYLYDMVEWLQDLNWPGALIIQDRLKVMARNKAIRESIEEIKVMAEAINDDDWVAWIKEVLD